jgi:hypothetical protein
MMGSQIGPDRPEFCDALTQILERGVTKNRTHIHLAIGRRLKRGARDNRNEADDSHQRCMSHPALLQLVCRGIR